MKIMKIFQDCKKVIVYVQFSITFYQKQINECAFGKDHTNNTTNLMQDIKKPCVFIFC